MWSDLILLWWGQITATWKARMVLSTTATGWQTTSSQDTVYIHCYIPILTLCLLDWQYEIALFIPLINSLQPIHYNSCSYWEIPGILTLIRGKFTLWLPLKIQVSLFLLNGCSHTNNILHFGFFQVWDPWSIYDIWIYDIGAYLYGPCMKLYSYELAGWHNFY